VKRVAQPAVILFAAVAVLAVFAALSALPPDDQTDPSSRAAGKAGTLALYTWFDDLGLPVHRITGQFDLSGTDVLISYAPATQFTDSDVAAVMAHLRRGGDVVLALTPESPSASLAAAAPLLNALDVQPGETTAPGDAGPVQPFDATDRVHSVRFGGGIGFLDAPPLVPLLSEDGTVVAAMTQVAGGGRAYVIGDTLPLSNDGLRHGDARWFALSLLERARGGHVGFDEYHHGEATTSDTGAAAIFNGPVGLAAALAFVVVLAFLGLSGRRLGRPVTAHDSRAVPTAATYATALGQLFARSRERGAIATRYADDLKRRLSAASGADAHLDDDAFIAAAASGDEDRAVALRGLLQRARTLAAARPGDAALLQLARDIDAFERAWVEAVV